LSVATLHLILHSPPRVPRFATAQVAAPRLDPAPVAPSVVPVDFCAPDRLRAARRDGNLSHWDIRCALRTTKPMIDACFPEHPVRQHFKIRLLIGKSGRVLSAVTDERVAGTPAGACVERVMKSVRYAPSASRMAIPIAYMGE
jgi:hypothetical protein